MSSKMRARACSVSIDINAVMLAVSAELNPVFSKYALRCSCAECARCQWLARPRIPMATPVSCSENAKATTAKNDCGTPTTATHTCAIPLSVAIIHGRTNDLFTDYHTFVRVAPAFCKLKHAATGHIDVFKLLVKAGRNDYSAAMQVASRANNIPVIMYLNNRHQSTYVKTYSNRWRKIYDDGHHQFFRHVRRSDRLCYPPRLKNIGRIIKQDVYSDTVVRFVYAENIPMVLALIGDDTVLRENVRKRIRTSARIVSDQMYQAIGYAQTNTLRIPGAIPRMRYQI